MINSAVLAFDRLTANDNKYLQKMETDSVEMVLQICAIVKSKETRKAGSGTLCEMGPTVSEVTRLIKCCICHEYLKDTRMCPSCTYPFCLKCSDEWLQRGAGNCPHCRKVLAKQDFIKAPTFDQMQEAIRGLISKNERNRCDTHKWQQISLFCIPCEECICSSCLFSEMHRRHKHSIVPLEEAEELFDQYMPILDDDIKWIVDRYLTVREQLIWNTALFSLEKARVNEKLHQLTQTGVQAANCRVDLRDLKTEWKGLLNAEHYATTLPQVLRLVKKIKQLRSEDSPGWNSPKMFKNDIFPEPTVLVFRLERFHENIQKTNSHLFKPQTSYGFSWVIRLINVQEDFYPCEMSLTEGKPGSYGVAFANKKIKLLSFELNTFVRIGDFYPVLNDNANDMVEIVVHVRCAETYEEKCSQLKEYIDRMEQRVNTLENAKNSPFFSFACNLKVSSVALWLTILTSGLIMIALTSF